MCVRVHGRAPRSPARPTPASCSPLCDASRIPNARSHPPGRSHSRTHAHTRARAHPPPPHTRLRTPDSRPPGALTKAPGPGLPEPPERGLRSGPAVLPGWPRLRSSGAPRGAPSGVPAPSPCPAGPRPCSKPDPRPGSPTPASGAPTQRRWLPPPRLLRRLQPRALPLLSFPLFCHCLSFYLLSFLPPAAAPIPVLSLSGCLSILPTPSPAPLPHRPALPSHSPHYMGCRPPLAGPRVRTHCGRRGDPPSPGPTAPSALRLLLAPRCGLAGGYVPR